MNFINAADLDSGNGKTYREINNAKGHTFKVGDLVGLDNGARLFVGELTRDCDGTPLYSLSPGGKLLIHGHPEDGMVLIIDSKDK